MNWKQLTPPPQPEKEEFEVLGNTFRIRIYRGNTNEAFRGFGDVTKYGVCGQAVTDLETAKATALQNLRDHLAAALAEVDAAIAEVPEREAAELSV